MNLVIRGAVAYVSMIATYYLVWFAFGGLLMMADIPDWVAPLGAIIAGLAAASFVWIRSSSYSSGLVRSVGIGGLVVGGAGFAAGVFGPVVLASEASQSPLLGILLTGPLGLLGAVIGGIHWYVWGKHEKAARLLAREEPLEQSRAARRIQFSLGVLLVTLSVVSIGQSIREVVLWETGRARYDEEHFLDLPITFAGHVFSFEDNHPYVPSAPASSQDGFPGMVRIMMDGKPLAPPTRAVVRRGLTGMGRYHLWVDASVFHERRTRARTLWLVRRLQARNSDSPTFEVTRIDESGRVIKERLRGFQLGRDYPTFRASQFVSWGVSAIPLSMLDAFFFPPILLVFPIGSLVIGGLLVRSSLQWRNDEAAI